jgi:hypothetical protein
MTSRDRDAALFDIFFVTLVACVGYVVVWAFVSGV